MEKRTIFSVVRLCAVAAISMIIALFVFASGKTYADAAESEGASITVYSWEDYMEVGEEGNITADNDLIYKFEQETGISVEYVTFATNEDMYNELIKNPDGCDLICPSEYMIMKMRDENLLKAYTAPENWVTYGSPYIKQIFEELGMNTEDGKTYAIGYMWGTMGFLYNMDKTSAEELKNWNSIWGEKFKGKVTIKDSIRDSYIMTLGALYQDELLALDKNAADYSDKLFTIFNRTDDKTVSEVEKLLKDLKKNLYGFEVDSGKNDIITGKIDVNFAWSGDAVYTIDEGEELGKNFGYVVPEEGSNVWFDGWVMPKNADEENAVKFLNFISAPESAMRNMDYIGYVSCIAGDEVFEYVKEQEDSEGENVVNLGYFFGGSDDVYNVRVEDLNKQLATQYPDYSVIQRCAVMDNFDSETLDKINEMWNRVKFITFPTWAIILIVVGVVLFIGVIVVIRYREKIAAAFGKNKKKTAKQGNK